MPEMIDSLLLQLQAADVAQRSKAVLRLGELGMPDAVDALVTVLFADDDLSVQEDATWSLVRLGEPAIEPLVKGLSHEDAHIRHNAAHTLGKLGNAQALNALILATEDADSSVRYKAVYALGQIGHEDGIRAVIARLDDPVTDVSWMSREVLEGFGLSAIGALIEALGAESAQTRELAAEILGEIGDAQAVAPLTKALDTDDWEVRFAIVQALGQIGDSQARDALAPLLDDENSRVRAITKMILAELDSKT